MAPVATAVQQLVNENGPEDFLQASEILLKFAENVLKNPNDPKYRKIRVGNPIVMTKLLPVSGAMECLFEMGFVEDGEHLTLPQTATLSHVNNIKSQLEKERVTVQRSTPAVQAPPSSAVTGASSNPAPRQAVPPTQNPELNPDLLMKEIKFMERLQSQLQHVQIYEDPRLQQKAREIIPVAQLTDEACTTLQQLQQAQGQASGDTDQRSRGPQLDLQDCLILRLLNWFKNSFFRWVDAPACRSCGGKTTMQGNVQPSDEELRWGGNRVENYRCNTCAQFTRFVRYNHPGKLLDTREGRCGEWANCFTLCCRALNFEARYVLDWTDHVWTEIYSNSQQRWMHCDPCENTCDKPLLYDVGWGKKLSYIIAFSVDDIEDVTWRYVTNFKDVLSRRTECREKWLVYTIQNLDRDKWEAMPDAKRNTRLKRKIVELVEFMTPKAGDGQNLSGRTTGSMEWRLARGELGSQTQKPAAGPYTFQLSEKEKQNKCLHVTYSCAKDEYCRRSQDGAVTTGFATLLTKNENVFRKVEHDWKMAYLARTEGSSTAEIAWKFDLEGSGLKIDHVEVKVDCATYENGKIHWLICGDEMCCPVTSSPSMQSIKDLQGETTFTLTATLTGGKGDVAWQHTQLFRQSSEDQVNCPFEIRVHLK